MKFWFTIIILFVAITPSLWGQTDIKVDFYGCSVQSGTDIVLRWTPLSASADIASYDVYHAVGGGPFAKVVSISSSITGTWTHADIASDNQVHRYFIQAFNSGVPSENSDTLFTIVPVATNTNDQTVELQWNAYAVNPHPSAGEWYQIYKATNGQPWVLIDSTTSNQYTDTPGICLEQVQYRVSWRAYNNQNFSQSTLTMSDLAQPLSPAIDSISVDDDGNILFGWQRGASPDTKDYIIFQYYNGIWDTLTRISTATITSYIEININATNEPRIFSMASVDQCGNATADLGIPRKVQTMWMAPPVHQVCDKHIELNWTPYIAMPDSLAGYKLMVSTENGPFVPFDTLAPDSLHGVFSNPEHNTLYRFKAVAFNGSGITSSSSASSILVYLPKAPQYAYVRYATVEQNRFVNLSVVNDTTAQTAGLVVERSLAQNEQFIVLDTLIPDGRLVTYSDSTARPSREAYTYRVMALDSCSAAVLESNHTRTMWLRLANGATGELEWTAHEGYEAGLSHYRIDRLSDTTWKTIGTATNTETTFFDPDYAALIPLQTIQYRVVAFEAEGNSFMYTDSTFSNVINAIPAFRLFVPNAFRPRSTLNNSFKPVMLSVDARDYYFAVFNRFGQRIFETTNIDTGWDGKLKGEPITTGIYAYYIRILTSAGKYQEQRGMVTLVE